MSTGLIKAKIFIRETDFLFNTRQRICSFFEIPETETLICVLRSAFLFYDGFAVTDKALYWKFRTSDKAVEGKILKETTFELNTEFKMILAEQGISRLELSAGEQSTEFFIRGLKEERGHSLTDLLKTSFKDSVLIHQEDSIKNKIIETIKDRFDSCINFFKKKTDLIKSKWDSAFIEKKTGKKQTNKEEQTQTTEPKPSVKKPGKAAYAFAGIFDVSASTVFTAAVLIYLRFPDLTFLVLCAEIFTLLKISAILTVRRGINIILPCLLLVMTLLYSALTYNYRDPLIFTFFIVFTLLLWLSFNLSLGFTLKTIRIKIPAVLSLSFILYLIFLYKLDEEFADACNEIYKNLKIMAFHLLQS